MDSNQLIHSTKRVAARGCRRGEERVKSTKAFMFGWMGIGRTSHRQMVK